jgi:hypothetical protein
LVSLLKDNKTAVDSLTEELVSEENEGCLDPLVQGLLSKVSIILSSQWKMMETFVSELECIKTTVNDLVSIESEKASACSASAAAASFLPPRIAATESRRHLPQSPLYGSTAWSTVVGRKAQKGKANAPSVTALDDDTPAVAERPQVDPFTAAVREAERSVLIHNLNLGNTPVLNPTTISAKITTALVSAAACGDGRSTINDSDKEITSDIMSLVQGMELYGTGTRPCRLPGNPSQNGTYYTVPVKFSFQNKQTAQRVSDLLKTRYKINTSVPYHRSLRTSMNLVREKVKVDHPGKMIIVNLDFSNRSLEVKLRPEGARGSGGQWRPMSKKFKLPQEALDPRYKELDKITLPASPCNNGDTPTGDSMDTDIFSFNIPSTAAKTTASSKGAVPKDKSLPPGGSLLSRSPPQGNSNSPILKPMSAKTNRGKQP